MQTQRRSKKLQQWCETLSARFYAKNSLTYRRHTIAFSCFSFLLELMCCKCALLDKRSKRVRKPRGKWKYEITFGFQTHHHNLNIPLHSDWLQFYFSSRHIFQSKKTKSGWWWKCTSYWKRRFRENWGLACLEILVAVELSLEMMGKMENTTL